MIRYWIILFLLIMPSPVEATTETFYLTATGAGTKSGTSLANAMGSAEFNNSSNWDTDVQDDNLIGPDDEVLIYDDHGIIRGSGTSVLEVQQSGTSGNVIAIKAGTNESPVVSASDLVSTWSDAPEPAPANVWRATLNGATEGWWLWYDGTAGTPQDAVADCTIQGDFYHDTGANYMYLNSGGDGDPDNYSNLGVEVAQRSYALNIDGKDHITVSGNITFRHAKAHGVTAEGGCSNIIFDGITCTYNYQAGLATSGSDGDVLTTDVTVRNCTISYNGGIGIDFSAYTQDSTAEYNDIHHNCILYEHANHTYAAGIRAGITNVEGILTQYNDVHNNGDSSLDYFGGVGIWYDGDSVGGTDSFQSSSNISRIRYNFVRDNITGIMTENVSYVEVLHNIVDNSYNGTTRDQWGRGIYVYRECHENKIYNNTLYSNRIGIGCIGDYPKENDNMTNNIFTNNIVCDSHQQAIDVRFGGENDGTYGSGNVFIYNCFDGESSNFIQWGNAQYCSTYDDWEAAYGGSTNSLEADPRFADAGNHDFTLQRASPCIASGDRLSSNYGDALMPGSSWPSNVVTGNQDGYGDWEIGAYIFHHTSEAPAAPTSLRFLGIESL